MLGLDALASAAYGPEAALTVLLAVGAAGVWYVGPITLIIVDLLALVYLSYRQTLAVYPDGGGSYTVARANLGVGAGLLAAAALMLDYVLLALAVVLVAKFADGAWVTVALLVGLVGAFLGVRRHYRAVARELATTAPLDATDLRPPLVVVLVRGWSRVSRKAVRFALRLSPEVYALHVAADEHRLKGLEEEWAGCVVDPCRAAGVPVPKLVVVTSPYRRLYAPLVEFLTELERTHPGRPLAVVVPELVERRWYHYLLHNQTAAVIKGYLYFSGLERVAVVNVPWYLRGDASPTASGHPGGLD